MSVAVVVFSSSLSCYSTSQKREERGQRRMRAAVLFLAYGRRSCVRRGRCSRRSRGSALVGAGKAARHAASYAPCSRQPGRLWPACNTCTHSESYVSEAIPDVNRVAFSLLMIDTPFRFPSYLRSSLAGSTNLISFSSADGDLKPGNVLLKKDSGSKNGFVAKVS